MSLQINTIVTRLNRSSSALRTPRIGAVPTEPVASAFVERLIFTKILLHEFHFA